MLPGHLRSGLGVVVQGHRHRREAELRALVAEAAYDAEDEPENVGAALPSGKGGTPLLRPMWASGEVQDHGGRAR